MAIAVWLSMEEAIAVLLSVRGAISPEKIQKSDYLGYN
jgi:hypothetical protein